MVEERERRREGNDESVQKDQLRKERGGWEIEEGTHGTRKVDNAILITPTTDIFNQNQQ